MSTKDEGGPAFPMPGGAGDFTVQVSHLGMTLRDYFAAHAMVAMINNTAAAKPDMEGWTHIVAKGAYMFADAMLEARKP